MRGLNKPRKISRCRSGRSSPRIGGGPIAVWVSAACILHLGLCLAGHKHVKFQQPGEEEDVIVDIEPGSVYFGGVTGARHQVVHCKALQHELVDAPLAERSCSVAIMMRTALFPHSRSRISDNQPNPKSAFRCMATAFREGLARLRLELPSLEECVTAEAGLTAEAPEGKATEAGLAAEASTGDATEAGLTAEASTGEATEAGLAAEKTQWWCACPVLKVLEFPQTPLQTGTVVPVPKRGDRIGNGTFGVVYRVSSSDSLVIKALRFEDPELMIAEVYALEKGRGHPHIVQLHDVFLAPAQAPMMPPEYCLLSERCDTDLSTLIRRAKEKGAATPPHQLRRTGSQACSAVHHLHSAGILHMDLKPSNILAKFVPGGSLFDIKVGDLGSCVQADPRAWSRSRFKLAD